MEGREKGRKEGRGERALLVWWYGSGVGLRMRWMIEKEKGLEIYHLVSTCPPST